MKTFKLDGSIWEDNEGNEMRINKVEGGFYGDNGDFDFLRETEEETVKQLKKWGYERL